MGQAPFPNFSSVGLHCWIGYDLKIDSERWIGYDLNIPRLFRVFSDILWDQSFYPPKFKCGTFLNQVFSQGARQFFFEILDLSSPNTRQKYLLKTKCLDFFSLQATAVDRCEYSYFIDHFFLFQIGMFEFPSKTLTQRKPWKQRVATAERAGCRRFYFSLSDKFVFPLVSVCSPTKVCYKV